MFYSTWFTDDVNALAVDAAGDAFLAGAASSGLPALNAFQSDPSPVLCPVRFLDGITVLGFNPCASGFVMALAPSGSSLLFSTWLNAGGSAELVEFAGSLANSLAVDNQGARYVGGGGSLSVAAEGPGQNTGTTFVLKLNPAGAVAIFPLSSIALNKPITYHPAVRSLNVLIRATWRR